MAFDQISFTALNFFNFPFFVAEIWLHLRERLPPQCHVVVTGHMAYQNCQSVLSVANETFLKDVMQKVTNTSLLSCTFFLTVSATFG